MLKNMPECTKRYNDYLKAKQPHDILLPFSLYRRRNPGSVEQIG